MAGLESDKVEKMLLRKMHATRRESKDVHYIIYNDQKKQVSSNYSRSLVCHKTLLALNSCPSTLYFWFDHRKSYKAAPYLDQNSIRIHSSIGLASKLSTSYPHKI